MSRAPLGRARSGAAGPSASRPQPARWSTAPASGRSRTPSSRWTPPCSPAHDAASSRPRPRRCAPGRARAALRAAAPRRRPRGVAAGDPRATAHRRRGASPRSSRSRSTPAAARGRRRRLVRGGRRRGGVRRPGEVHRPVAGPDPEHVLWDEKRREDELRSLDIRVVRDRRRRPRHRVVRRRDPAAPSAAAPGPAQRRFRGRPAFAESGAPPDRDRLHRVQAGLAAHRVFRRQTARTGSGAPGRLPVSSADRAALSCGACGRAIRAPGTRRCEGRRVRR